MSNRGRIESAAQDFMCYPQLVNDPFRNEGETYAQSLRGHIEWILSEEAWDEGIDPNDVMILY